MSEHTEQAALFEWAEWNLGKYPGLEMLYAIPNGGSRASKVNKKGERYSPEAQRLQAEGVKPGVFDISLDVSRGGYHGLRIEMKTREGKPSKEQLKWLERYVRHGYYPAICRGWEAARDVIVTYLNFDRPEQQRTLFDPTKE